MQVLENDSSNLSHPRHYGMKGWQSYLENKISGAMRMYWVYGPDQKDITIIGQELHPEDTKTGTVMEVIDSYAVL